MSKCRYKIHLLVLLFILVVTLSGFYEGADIRTISFKVETNSLHKGRVTMTEIVFYYNLQNGRIVKNYLQPEGKVVILDDNGEMKVYDKIHNVAFSEEYPGYNTEENIVLFFLSPDFDLADFDNDDIHEDDKEVKEDSIPAIKLKPAFSKHMFDHIKVNYHEGLPCFAEYYDLNENLIVKTYFADYEFLSHITLPLTVREFIYINENDSIINLINLSDIRINNVRRNDFFDFEIPGDAEVLD